MITRTKKRCPRCNKLNPINQDRCISCDLVFSRLKNVTNASAKKAIKNKEYNKVINYNVLPPDLNKWKLFFTALFLGWFGAHFYKVGKYKTFIYMLVSVILILLVATQIVPMSWFDHKYLFLIAWGCILPASIGTMIWIVTTVQILFNRFKVPVAIDPSLVQQNLNYDVVQDVLRTSGKIKNQEIENKDKNKKPLKRERIKVVCASCGKTVKVYNDETICPKCDEPLKGD